MLVLTRKQDQIIKVGDDITITICKIQGDRVRVGIEAPDNIVITRPDAKKGAREVPGGVLPQIEPAK